MAKQQPSPVDLQPEQGVEHPVDPHVLIPDLVAETSHRRHVLQDLPEPVDEDRIVKDVSLAINSLLEAQQVWTNGRNPHEATLADEDLTPAQRFYLENRELLLRRATEYSVTKANNDFERATQDMQDEWAFYKDPVVRPRKGHLWDPDILSESGPESEFSEDPTVEFVHGQFPQMDEIIHLLQQEKVADISAIDLDLCSRRDIGEWAIVGTVQSAAHGDRVGNLARRKINALDLDNIKCFINAIPGQEWVVVRLGPVVVHLMTESDRQQYRLEDIYVTPAVDEEVRRESLEGSSDSLIQH